MVVHPAWDSNRLSLAFNAVSSLPSIGAYALINNPSHYIDCLALKQVNCTTLT